MVLSGRVLRRKGGCSTKPMRVAPHGIVWKNVDSVAVLIMHDLLRNSLWRAGAGAGGPWKSQAFS